VTKSSPKHQILTGSEIRPVNSDACINTIKYAWSCSYSYNSNHMAEEKCTKLINIILYYNHSNIFLLRYKIKYCSQQIVSKEELQTTTNFSAEIQDKILRQ
jgi:hypothetical protein